MRKSTPSQRHLIAMKTAVNQNPQNTVAKIDIYAYDAYIIGCALKHKYPILTLDKGLMDAARKAGAAVKEVEL
jgi:predicted nucleic acid-binding protein